MRHGLLTQVSLQVCLCWAACFIPLPSTQNLTHVCSCHCFASPPCSQRVAAAAGHAGRQPAAGPGLLNRPAAAAVEAQPRAGRCVHPGSQVRIGMW